MTFLLKIDETTLEAPYLTALRKELAQSRVTKIPSTDPIVDGKYSIYTGYNDYVTTSLDYLLDELLPLDSFVCLAIHNNTPHIRGKAYLFTFFNPNLVFNNGMWTITKPLYQIILNQTYKESYNDTIGENHS